MDLGMRRWTPAVKRRSGARIMNLCCRKYSSLELPPVEEDLGNEKPLSWPSHQQWWWWPTGGVNGRQMVGFQSNHATNTFTLPDWYRWACLWQIPTVTKWIGFRVSQDVCVCGPNGCLEGFHLIADLWQVTLTIPRFAIGTLYCQGRHLSSQIPQDNWDNSRQKGRSPEHTGEGLAVYQWILIICGFPAP